MIDIARTMKILGDMTRLRIVYLISREEVTVTELSNVLGMPQPRISSHMAQLREILPLTERRQGRRIYLGLDHGTPRVARLMDLLTTEFEGSGQAETDLESLARVMAARDDGGFFDAAAEALGKRYLPGRTWEGFARTLLRLVEPLRVVDVGVGEGEMTLLLARFAKELVAIDPDAAALNRLQTKATKAGHHKLKCLRGRCDSMPLGDNATDLVMVSQVLQLVDDPLESLIECRRVLSPGGRVIVLDLKRHREAWVREKLGHQRLGFTERELQQHLEHAGFSMVEISPVARDARAPHFVTLQGIGSKEE